MSMFIFLLGHLIPLKGKLYLFPNGYNGMIITIEENSNLIQYEAQGSELKAVIPFYI